MKSISQIILTIWVASHFAAQAQTKEDDQSKVWPMFRRMDVVTLHDKQIPDEYKRYRITDSKGRVLEGEWLEIDRKNKIVKFRRTGGKEFDIPFAELCEIDRRYAELETGYLWDIGETPPVPHNLIIPTPKDHLDFPPEQIVINSFTNDQIIKAEMVGEETVRVTVKHVSPTKKESTETATDLPVKYLTASDRDMIKKATNLEVPVVARPAWTKENYKYWVSWDPKEYTDGKRGRGRIQYHFYEPTPVFRPEQTFTFMNRPMPVFVTAWGGMTKQYSTDEIYDHLRVKTLTSDFIYKYSDYLRQQKQQGSRCAAYKSLQQVMEMLVDAEPTKERVSLKAKIDKSAVKLFEEQTPTELPGKPKVGEPNGPPLDGRLQGYLYIAQYLHVSKGKAKIPLADFLSNMEIRQIGRGDGRAGFLSFDEDEIHKSLEKTFGLKAWSVPGLYSGRQNRNLEDFNKLLSWKIVRQQIRNSQPVIVFKNEGYAIITGFTTEPGKETTYDAYMLDGASTLGNMNGTNLPYKVSEKSNVLQSEFAELMSFEFLE